MILFWLVIVTGFQKPPTERKKTARDGRGGRPTGLLLLLPGIGQGAYTGGPGGTANNNLSRPITTQQKVKPPSQSGTQKYSYSSCKIASQSPTWRSHMVCKIVDVESVNKSNTNTCIQAMLKQFIDDKLQSMLQSLYCCTLAASAQIGLISLSMASAPSAMDRILLFTTPTFKFHYDDL